MIVKNSIQIYQALRKDSGNYISEEDWHISIFPRAKKKLGIFVLYPFFPSLKQTKRFGFAQQRNPSALTE